jgi:hypothetical protein
MRFSVNKLVLLSLVVLSCRYLSNLYSILLIGNLHVVLSTQIIYADSAG